MTSTLLVLGGGPLAAPVLRWAREAGLGTALAHPDPRPPLRRLADELHPIPEGDGEAHAALARRLARTRGLAGIHASGPEQFALLPALSDAAPRVLPPRDVLARLARPEETRAFLRAQGLPVAGSAEDDVLDVFAFFRDGAFVPGGLAARRTLANGDVASLQPSGLDAEREHAAYVLVERAARALGLERGLVQATLVADENGPALVALHPGFVDAIGATHVARHAHGRSPLQAWVAHLAGAGGPFDELMLGRSRCAGWLSIRSRAFEAGIPDPSGLFAGIDGVARARAVPGWLGVWSEEPGRALGGREQRPLGYLWAEARDPGELLERLQAARAALEVRIACRPLVA